MSDAIEFVEVTNACCDRCRYSRRVLSDTPTAIVWEVTRQCEEHGEHIAIVTIGRLVTTAHDAPTREATGSRYWAFTGH